MLWPIQMIHLRRSTVMPGLDQDKPGDDDQVNPVSAPVGGLHRGVGLPQLEHALSIALAHCCVVQVAHSYTRKGLCRGEKISPPIMTRIRGSLNLHTQRS